MGCPCRLSCCGDHISLEMFSSFWKSLHAKVGAICDLQKNKMCLTNVNKTVFYDLVENNKGEKLISYIELSGDLAPTPDSSRKITKTASASFDALFASFNSLRISEQTETEKPKSGGIVRKKKKKVDAYFLSLIPVRCHEEILSIRHAAEEFHNLLPELKRCVIQSERQR